MEKPARFFFLLSVNLRANLLGLAVGMRAGRINRLAAGLSESPVYVGGWVR